MPYAWISFSLKVLALNSSSLDFVAAFVLLHTLPVLYEKYEDQVDSFAEKAHAEFNKQYAVFDAKVLSKIPRGPLKDKKRDWNGKHYVGNFVHDWQEPCFLPVFFSCLQSPGSQHGLLWVFFFSF